MTQPESREEFEQPRSDFRVEDGIRRGARIEVAMTFRGVALRHRRAFTRGVMNHVTAAGTPKHGGRHPLARVLAMREPQVAAAFRATPARLAFAGEVDAHRFKPTALSAP